MTNFIFVDFDGPLLPGKQHLFKENREAVEAFLKGNNPIPYFDPVAVRMHNLWAKYGNAKVVFSTSWARNFRGSLHDCEKYLKQIMIENGYEGEFADACITPKRITSNHIHEIQEWCDDNLQSEDKFIAVDDADLSFLANEQCSYVSQGKWIQVDYSNGLSWKNFKDGCAHLDIDNDVLMQAEFGIAPLSPEQKAQRQRDLEIMLSCI